jgi:predicted permease
VRPNPEDVQIVRFDLAIDGYDAAQGVEFMRVLTDRLNAAPGVIAAGIANDLPLDMGRRATGSYPEGNGDRNVQADFNQVSPGYFDAIGMKLLQGRFFRGSDVATGEKVIIVSKHYAETAWPGQNPIGKRIRWDNEAADPKVVVGVVGNTKTGSVMDQDDPMLYLPQSQEYASAVTLLVRTKRTGREAATFIRNEIAAVDPNLSMTPVQTLEGVTSMGTLPQRMAAIISASLGVLALLLSGMGIYGVIAYMVTQRTREVGVRVAIGAQGREIMGLVVRSGLRLALPGILIGIVLALGLAQLMRAFILGVAPLDPITFTVVPALLLAMIGIATWVPARRAMKISPMVALRSE